MLIPGNAQREMLFLSVAEIGKGEDRAWALLLHTNANNGSCSTRQEVFQQHVDFADLAFDTVAIDNNHFTVKISPKLAML